MKRILYIIFLIISISCGAKQADKLKKIEQKALKNEAVKSHHFLDCMYQDTYFPKSSVDKCKDVLLLLCNEIDDKQPKSLPELYKLTQQSTTQINDLQSDFENNGSEIETGARECIAMEFDFIAKSYGFQADVEEMIANREW